MQLLPPLALQAPQPDEPENQDNVKEMKRGVQLLTMSYPVSIPHADWDQGSLPLASVSVEPTNAFEAGSQDSSMYAFDGNEKCF